MNVFGALPPKKDIREYKVASISSLAIQVNIPDEFELKMPEVKNQGNVNSCVAHSLATIVEYFNNLQEDTDTKFSIGYIYGNRIGHNYNDLGMYVDKAINNVVKWGDVDKQLFPENIEVPEAITLFQERGNELFPDAYPNRFTSFFHLATDEEIKLNLLKNGPVIFSIAWYSDYYVEKDTYIMKHFNNNISGYHCMVIYGWNKDGWKFQNSWGKSFGNKGRAVLPYGTYFSTCYGITDTISEKEKREQILKLEEQIKEITNDLNNKQKELEELNQVILNQNKDIKNKDNELLKTKKELEKQIKSLEKSLKKIEEQNEQLKLLNEELLEIKKPFNNMPEWLVTIINFILNLFK